MRIIKEGNPNLLKNPIVFTCTRCGCVFEALDDEYTIDEGMIQYAKYECPCCDNEVMQRIDM